jgi:threonylcarbamoyladenosine tRNA methylthiotransferase MtaB
MAITTDVIAGFPGETEAEFAESLVFVESLELAGGHAFTYSTRPGTAAARLRGQVPHSIRKQRNARLRQSFAAASAAYQARFLGRVLPVLWEAASALGPDGWRLTGLTDNYLRVQALAPQRLWNQITPVRLTALDNDGLHGLVLVNPAEGELHELHLL